MQHFLPISSKSNLEQKNWAEGLKKIGWFSDLETWHKRKEIIVFEFKFYTTQMLAHSEIPKNPYIEAINGLSIIPVNGGRGGAWEGRRQKRKRVALSSQQTVGESVPH